MNIKLKCFLWNIFIFTLSYHFIGTDAVPANLPTREQQTASQPLHFNPDSRPQLSSVQQQQIFNDIQQHQQQLNFVSSDPKSITFSDQFQIASKSDPLTTTFPSLAKYRVDRSKPTLQHDQNSHQFFQTAQTQYQIPNRYNFASPAINSFNSFPNNLPLVGFQNPQEELNYQTYLEKQHELELLRKQREQLILEQQELKKQQELLRLQQFRATSTTPRPTTVSTTTTTKTSTSASVLVPSPSSRKITPAESEIFLKAIATHQKKFTTSSSTSTSTPTTTSTTNQRITKESAQEKFQSIPKDILALIQQQHPHLLKNNKSDQQIKIIYQTEKPTSHSTSSKARSLENDLLLKQLKLALLDSSKNENKKNVTTRDLVLPNGRKLQVIQANNGLSSIIPNEGSSQFQTVTQALDAYSNISTTTTKPVKEIIEELTKGIVPPGADFEVLRQKDGKIEKVAHPSIQNQSEKKITFVVLEEQLDGTFKVQDIKGNVEKEIGTDIDSIVNKIKKGELKLPPSSKNIDKKSITAENKYVDDTPTTYRPSSTESSSTKLSGFSDIPKHQSETVNALTTQTTPLPNSVLSTDNYITSASSASTSITNILNSIPNHSSTSASSPASNFKFESSSIQPRSHFIPTLAPTFETISTTIPPLFSTTLEPHTSSLIQYKSNSAITTNLITPSSPSTTVRAINNVASENLIFNDVSGRNSFSNLNKESIANFFKKESLFAMAKYLRQSGLDSVLNETGPYTIFVPTDKAFKALLIQLGGPEKAEQKFRENPRLLSGLLLHHVIPGAFKVDSLQEEMTGVSLAGTQLRVNLYNMHDHEWNDIQITTINGARIVPNKKDIIIPQGIAHAVDRVMFPLPVGDLMQTLAADREQRFGIFIKMLQFSGLDETLIGTKTYTVFAPTDAAFTAFEVQNGRPVWIEADGQEVAKTIVARHIMPTTLFSAGMRYYHQKDTLQPHFTLRIQKNGGRIRVNEGQIVTPNIPATNGVLHAIDTIL
ncbi:uncharacterized protein [Chelonus insularis]|uniref:uncharacterized protein n=1 Tax=Chelonus insularis TaxID=460826 RepID=UPI00158832F2|nr:uncharacterized protein LOC118070726 [Chelonus insularis]